MLSLRGAFACRRTAMPLPTHLALPALLIACAFAATAVAPAHAAIVTLPPQRAALALAAIGPQVGDGEVVQVTDALPQRDAHATVRRSQPARRCGPGAACADGDGRAPKAGDTHADAGRYDFYWRIRVDDAGSGTRASGDGDQRDLAVDVAVARDDGAAVPRTGALRGRSPWLFVDAPARRLPGAGDGFVLVADRGAAVQGDPSARLPDVDPQVDALPEPPAWTLLTLGLAWLCVAAWRRHTRAD
jgi:hypothetical protein